MIPLKGESKTGQAAAYAAPYAMMRGTAPVIAAPRRREYPIIARRCPRDPGIFPGTGDSLAQLSASSVSSSVPSSPDSSDSPAETGIPVTVKSAPASILP